MTRRPHRGRTTPSYKAPIVAAAKVSGCTCAPVVHRKQPDHGLPSFNVAHDADCPMAHAGRQYLITKEQATP